MLLFVAALALNLGVQRKGMRFGMHIMTYEVFSAARGLLVRVATRACWLAYFKIRSDVERHSGTSGILHSTYYIFRHAKSFSGILNGRIVQVQEHRACFYFRTSIHATCAESQILSFSL